MLSTICFATSNIEFINNEHTIYLNANNKTLLLETKNTANQKLIWTSSNASIASVNENGTVTAKTPGVVTITVKTDDGKMNANCKVNVKEKVLIVVGSSQVTRMLNHAPTYNSDFGTYSIQDGTLNYIEKASSKIEYQTTEAVPEIIKILEKRNKSFTEFHLFFPLVGNTIKTYAVKDITTSNKSIKNYVKAYNDVVKDLKADGYQINGYVVSMHPLKPGEATSNDIVSNTNKNSQKAGYRSNVKYYTFNKVVKSHINNSYSSNLEYIETFKQIMETNEKGKAFSYKMEYITTNGMLWDKNTTIKYVDLMFDACKDISLEPVTHVTSIKLDKQEETILLNKGTGTIQLNATVFPENATNKKIKWSSNSESVATVDSNGLVTLKDAGTATITAKTVDGGKTAKFKVTVKKKVVIVLGASQVVRMRNYVPTYIAPSENVYSKDNQTLVYLCEGGTGIDYQTEIAWPKVIKMAESYKKHKDKVEFYIFFPLVGNTIKLFTSEEINTSNPEIIRYVKAYNEAIKSLEKDGFNVKGFVVSMHPVKPGDAPSNSQVVSNTSKNAGKPGYRSNIKYYLFNKSVETLMKNDKSNTLTYLETFKQIMETNEKGKAFKYKIQYKTDDGVHWDSPTTKVYVDMMLNMVNEL